MGLTPPRFDVYSQPNSVSRQWVKSAFFSQQRDHCGTDELESLICTQIVTFCKPSRQGEGCYIYLGFSLNTHLKLLVHSKLRQHECAKTAQAVTIVANRGTIHVKKLEQRCACKGNVVTGLMKVNEIKLMRFSSWQVRP